MRCELEHKHADCGNCGIAVGVDIPEGQFIDWVGGTLVIPPKDFEISYNQKQ